MRKWLVAAMAVAFLVGGLVGCEPQETGGDIEPTTVTTPTTAEAPGTAAAPGTATAPGTAAKIE